MKNIEKYKEEINEAINDRYVEDILCEINENIMGERPLVDCCYSGSEMCENCHKNVMKWLLEEYKEPILTIEEKEYLKNVTEPKKDDITWIRKWCFYKGTESEYTTVTVYAQHPAYSSPNSLWVLLDFIVTEEMPFKGMELEKAYSLEELGL